MNTNESICYIVGAMPLEKECLPVVQGGDLLIAADSGYLRLQEHGIKPDLLVGDFDSMPMPADFPNILKLPRIKEETDVGYALTEGLQRGYRRFILLGCSGGGLDHTLANLQQLLRLEQEGAAAFLLGDGQCVAAIERKSMTFPPVMSGRISVFCAAGDGVHVTLDGLQYPLQRHWLTPSFPLGVSNAFLEIPSVVTAHDGMVWIIWDRGQHLIDLPALFSMRKEGTL